MPAYFLGVSRGEVLSDPKTSHSFWCVPNEANAGDLILLYCPRAASAARQGIFAEAVIAARPDPRARTNSYCRGYGLLYVPIEVKRRFRPTLTAVDMKGDPVLSKAPVVRKNFQGTTFPLDPGLYERILRNVEAKARNYEWQTEAEGPSRNKRTWRRSSAE